MIGFLIFYWLFCVLFFEGYIVETEQGDDWKTQALVVLFGGMLFPVFFGMLIVKILGGK